MGGFALYLGCGGSGLRTPLDYQPSSFRTAAVTRPDTTPARMSATNCFILLGRAVGFRLRRFFFAIGFPPFLMNIIYLCEYKYKMENCTNMLA